MSGSRAHEADFLCALPQLHKILSEYSIVHLYLNGHSEFGKFLESEYPNQVTINAFSDYYSYMESYLGMDLNIIPLVQDDFNDCKSAIRYLEASLFNVPTIVSYTGDFKNIIKEDYDAYFVRDNERWYDKIKFAINNQEQIKQVAQMANASVTSLYKIESLTIDPELISNL
jgi:glycosyltransferase involved in cell wall biosynthesis